MDDYKPKPKLLQRIQEQIILLEELIGICSLSGSNDPLWDQMVKDRSRNSINLLKEVKELLE